MFNRAPEPPDRSTRITAFSGAEIGYARIVFLLHDDKGIGL
jgi:hypothetical protein